MKVLFLHGLESNPGGAKVEHLEGLGHTVLNPALPKHDFEESVRIAQEEVDTTRPDVIVGSSRGGAIAMAVDRAGARLVLIAPAWQRFGGTASVPPGTTVLHCTTDEQVPFEESEELEGANLIPCGESHRMIDPSALESLGQAVEGTLRTESLLREYVRDLLIERGATAFGKPSDSPGKKNVYRGMKITMPSTQLASMVRKYIQTDTAGGASKGELLRFILGQLESESTGVSWSTSFDTAVSFADAWGATNRGKTLHIILQATIDEEAGYDPITAGEEPVMFWDENEVRLEPGAKIPLTALYVFIKSKDEWAKMRSQFSLFMLKDEDEPVMVRA